MNLVTDVTQCNGSSNEAAHPLTCAVAITNNISADTPGALPGTAVTVNQCVGSGTGAIVTQCNGLATGGGSTADCAVSSASMVSPAIGSRSARGLNGPDTMMCRSATQL